MSKRLPGVLCAVLTLLSFSSQAVTIDFQSLEHTDSVQTNHGPSYTEDGFTIAGVNLFSNGTQRTDYNGSTALFFGLQGVNGTLTANSGGAFNLSSIDLVEVNPGTPIVSFTGFLAGGGTVTQDFTLDGSFGMGFGFETFNFTGFDNVTSVVWQSLDPFHQFDNIVVSAVPLPAAAWLFASGMLGLFGLARRKRIPA